MTRTFTYNDLRRYIGRKLAMSRTVSELAADANWNTDVEDILADALERFYDPDIIPPDTQKHQWSFLAPTIPLHFVDGVYAYDLPENFSMFNGPITYGPSDAVYYELEFTSPERVLYQLQRNENGGRPCLAAYRVKNALDVSETLYELLVYPTPDEDCVAFAPIKINPLIIGQATEVPLGGQPHRQTILAACQAECAAYNEEDDRYEARFQKRLQASISHDRQVNCPWSLGLNLDRSDALGYFGDYRDRRSYLVTYENQSW